MGRKLGYRKEVTVADVARRADVSISTVSRVINNAERVSPETKKAIIEAMTELGYKPRSTADFELPVSSKNIAVMVNDLRSPFNTEVAESVARTMVTYDYLMTLFVNNADNDILELHLNEAHQRNLDGVIIVCSNIPADSPMNHLIRQMNVVSIQSEIENVDIVDSTDEAGTMEVVEHLIGLGHRRIAFLGFSNMTMFYQRFRGYRKVLEAHGIPFREKYVGFGYPSSKFSYDMTCRLLSMKDRPTAIHCFNELTASGVYLAVRDHKLHIPDDISLTCMDGTIISQLCTPTLTTVAQPIRSMAEIAADLLIKKITEGPTHHTQHITVPTKLVFGLSTAPPAAKG
jgi:DNA-binding LacI/PurR family transcriptional regulator